MKYYKLKNTIYAYDKEQVAIGLADNKTELTAEELELHINPRKTAEQLQAQAKEQAKKNGKPYTLNGKEYIVPLDKDAQDTVTAISMGYIAAVVTNTLDANTVKTTMEFKNGVEMPITTQDWMAFATWFKDERNSFFEVAL